LSEVPQSGEPGISFVGYIQQFNQLVWAVVVAVVVLVAGISFAVSQDARTLRRVEALELELQHVRALCEPKP
jgi:hypothetical protein